MIFVSFSREDIHGKLEFVGRTPKVVQREHGPLDTRMSQEDGEAGDGREPPL
ncbi:hypothetical protein GOP47_0030905, partial [Adiantum capillus-veneris]